MKYIKTHIGNAVNRIDSFVRRQILFALSRKELPYHEFQMEYVAASTDMDKERIIVKICSRVSWGGRGDQRWQCYCTRHEQTRLCYIATLRLFVIHSGCLLINDEAGRSRTDNSKSTGVCQVSKIWTFVAFLVPWCFQRWSRGCNTQGQGLCPRTPEYSYEVRNQINLLKPSAFFTYHQV
jgi:hypothetical protein